MKRKIQIPIYNVVVWLVVTNNISKEREKMSKWFGHCSHDKYDALCSYGAGHNFALFFEPSALTVEIVSHELFHLTHRILDWVGANFDSSHHEPAALLHGYLCETILAILFKPLKVKVEKIARW